MAPKMARIGIRVAIFAALCVLGFYIGRPLYWKLTATLQEIKEKDYSQEAVKQGFTDFMREAQSSMWGSGTGKTEQENAGELAGTKADNVTIDVMEKKGESEEGKESSAARRLTRRLLARIG